VLLVGSGIMSASLASRRAARPQRQRQRQRACTSSSPITPCSPG